MLSRLTQDICRFVGFESGAAFLLNETRDYLCLSVPSIFPAKGNAADIESASVPLTDRNVAQLLQLEAPVYGDYRTIPEMLRILLPASQRNSPRAAVVPLRADGTAVGLLLLAGAPRDRTVSDIERQAVALLASQAALVIGTAQAVLSSITALLAGIAEGKRQWEQTFDAISDGIFVANTEFTVTRANRAFAAMFEKHPRDIIGKKCFDILWGDTTPWSQCPILTWQQKRGDSPSPPSREGVIRGKMVQVNHHPITDSKGNLSSIVHIVKDVTEQKKMQELMIRSERLGALGEMASGVAHDFNNILTSIISWTELMLLASPPPRLRECAMSVYQAALDGIETVKRIQEYSRIRRNTEFVNIDLNKIVQQALEFARPRWREQTEKAGIAINISTEYADIPPARGNASDLRQVFLNILLNAMDAVADGGDIKIHTGQCGARVFASISDSGVGIPDEIQGKIFDPFFTTKDLAGTGLGLSVAYAIISRHNGEIIVESTPGQGSTFTVYLPVATIIEDVPQPEILSSGQQARILLIDDDEHILNSIGAMLQSEGHTVVKCSEGKRGIRLFSHSVHDVVITDLGMPGMNGWDVAAKVKEISADTPVLLLTGWGAEIDTDRLAELGVDGLIQKPCTLLTLRQSIDKALNQGRTARTTSPTRRAQTPEADPPLKVLIIEDNQMVGQALKERLETDGHLVFLTPSGGKGLQVSAEEDVDMVFCDLWLPDVSGNEVALKLKQRQRRPFVVLITGDVAAVDAPSSPPGTFDVVLPKPWKDSELRRVLEAALARRSYK